MHEGESGGSSLSVRDGRLLKPLQPGLRMSVRGLAQHLQVRLIPRRSPPLSSNLLFWASFSHPLPPKDAFLGRESCARECLSTVWAAPGRAPGAGSRHVLYACRSLALLQRHQTLAASKVRSPTPLYSLYQSHSLTNRWAGRKDGSCLHARAGSRFHALRARRCTHGFGSRTSE